MATAVATHPNLVRRVDHYVRPGQPAHSTWQAALVRYLENKPDTPYRVVRWTANLTDRCLFEYFHSLKLADMAVTFIR